MLWTLCRSQLLCAARRATDAFAVAPFVAGAFALGSALLPAVALWAGMRVGPLHADPETARALGLAAGLGAALAGCSVTLLAPARDAVGPQLEAAPISSATVFFGVTALPFSILAAALVTPLALFLAPVTRGQTAAALASLVTAFGLGAAGTEAIVALARRALRGAASAGGVAVICFAGPLTGASAAARGEGSARAFVLAPAAVALALVAGAMRPAEPPLPALVRARARGLFSAALARYARRPELRRNVLAGLVLAASGALLLRATGAPRESAALFGGATAVLAAAVVPLAASGIDRECAWLWRTAPWPQELVSLFAHGAALALGACAAAVGVALCWAVAPGPVDRIAALAPAAAVVLGAALLAGSLIPWRANRPLEQLASFAAFAALLTALSIALARIAPIVGAEEGKRAVALAVVSLLVCAGWASLVAGIRA